MNSLTDGEREILQDYINRVKETADSLALLKWDMQSDVIQFDEKAKLSDDVSSTIAELRSIAAEMRRIWLRHAHSGSSNNGSE